MARETRQDLAGGVEYFDANRSRFSVGVQVQASALEPTLWYISLVGAAMTLLYFMRIGDPVNLIGPVVGMIPYIRNLILIRRHHAHA